MLQRILCTVLLTTCLAAAQPSGDFWVGDSEGDDFNTKLHVEPGKATMELLSEDGGTLSKENLTVEQVDKDLFLLKGGKLEANLRWSGNGEAILWYTGSSEVYWCLQTTQPDESALEGQWKALAGRQIMAANFHEGSFSLKRNSGEEAAWMLYPVSSTLNELRVVSRTRSGESFLLYFVPIRKDAWLMRNHKENNSVILYRGDAEPWMAEELKKRKAAGR